MTKGKTMKPISTLKYTLLISILSTATSVDANATPNMCLGDPGTPAKHGTGTTDDPYQLVLGYDLCDITLVKSEDADSGAKNHAYPDDTIFFQYNFIGIPYGKDGNTYDRGFGVSLAVNELSSVTIGSVTSEPDASCAIAFDDKANETSDYQYNYYDGGCAFNKFDNSPNTLSGNVKFSIKLEGDQQIKREVSNGKLKQGPHGGWLGAGVVGINWTKLPVYTPFSMK